MRGPFWTPITPLRGSFLHADPHPIPHDREKYRWRNLVERLFSKLKNWRRVATRYDKTAESYLGFVALASVTLWLPFVHVA